MPRFGTWLRCTAALLLPAAICRAQATAAIDEVVISATRLPLAAAAQIYDVTTLGAGELAGRGSVADALGRVAGVTVQSPGGRSGMASLFLRGADPNFTAVLLDRIALNDSTNSRGGSVNVSEIDAIVLERIEVVSGPLSSLYGSGALAGAVNLVVPYGTRDPALTATLTGGSRRDYSGAVLLTGPLAWPSPSPSPGRLGGSLSVTAGDDGDAGDGSRFSNWSVTGKIAPLEGAGPGRLVVRLSGSDADAFPDSSGGARLAVRRTLQTLHGRDALIGVDRRVVARGALSLDVQGSWFQRRDDTISPGVAPSRFNTSGLPASSDASRYRRGGLQFVARYGRGAWSSAGGIEWQRDDGRSDGQLTFFGQRLQTSFDRRRDSRSAFAELGYAAAAWSADAALRADHVDGVGSRVTARGGLRIAMPVPGLALRASLGSGFKAPSFYALGNPLVGNPGLRAERSRSGEVGLAWSGNLGDGHALAAASVTAFRARFADLVDFDPGPPPRLVNRSEVISRGVTADLQLPVAARLALRAAAQYATTTDESGSQLLNRPRWRATAAVAWAVSERCAAEAQYGYTGRRDDHAIPTGTLTLASFHVVSLESACTLTPATRLRLVLDDALDARYEDAIGFASPGIRVRLSLTHRF